MATRRAAKHKDTKKDSNKGHKETKHGKGHKKDSRRK